MKVIDILNKIANGEEVKFRILSERDRYELSDGCNLYNETLCKDVRWYIDENWLNEEVEIIEDKKIEEIQMLDDIFETKLAINQTRRKKNEIIDYLNKEK